jgi:glycerol-3-phosphate dehydrogenase
MRRIETEILVIGGGATGTGVAWDAALRGFRVILVERHDLTQGTTGRLHGLLHSGGRYAIKDPQSAAECIAENRTLRRTHTHCIEDTGGFFVVTPFDEGDYPDRFRSACLKIGIPCEELPVAEALSREPLLNPKITRVFQVPDGAADVFQAAHSTAQAARLVGAQILTYHPVVGLVVENGRVAGARVRDERAGQETEIRAAMTINAAGPWAGQIAGLAKIDVNIIGGKGAILAVNHRVVNTVVNRCKMPGDGDIIVPVHTVAVIGTTDRRGTNPNDYAVQPWEVKLLLEEGEKLIPGVSNARIVRAWSGVRPLYQDSFGGSSRDATRAFTLLDHKARDGVEGLLTITGGKWTTFRLMAEKTLDKASEQIGVRKPCATASTKVPGTEVGHYWLGHRLAEVEEKHLQGDLVCECELVTRAMLENALYNNPTLMLDDLRRDVRLGMGPCQGGFCTYRAAGILHELSVKLHSNAHSDASNPESEAQPGDNWQVAHFQSPAHNAGKHPENSPPELDFESPTALIRDFVQERWKGLTSILWGTQLKQERLDELIYLCLMNADHLPEESKLSGSGPASTKETSNA